jgi:hypothetical protein
MMEGAYPNLLGTKGYVVVVVVVVVDPHDGRACIIDSSWETNKAGYKHFESVLR